MNTQQYSQLSLLQIAQTIGEDSTNLNPIVDAIFNFTDFHVYEQVVDEERMHEKLSLPSYEKNNISLGFHVSATFKQHSVAIHTFLPEEITNRLMFYFHRVLELMVGKEVNA